METQVPNTPTTEQPDQPTLTQVAVTAAATNSPDLATDTFKLGDRTFKVIDLDYDSYLEFMSFLQPLLEGIASKFAGKAGLSLPGIPFADLGADGGINSLLTFCKKDLPAMAALICNQQAIQEEREQDKVTSAWVKKHVKSPFEIVRIVMKQINKNKMISEFADFFVQILPLMGAVMGNQSTKPTE